MGTEGGREGEREEELRAQSACVRVGRGAGPRPATRYVALIVHQVGIRRVTSCNFAAVDFCNL